MSSSRIAVAIGALVALALLVLFAVSNRGQPIALDFGVWSWQGDAVFAIYAGVCVGLIVMFAVSLPSDLAIRREHRRLAHGGQPARRKPDADVPER